MIKGIAIKERDIILRPEVNYREITALNCSMVKLFDTDPVKFFEQYKLGKKTERKKTTSLIIGDIADFYLLDCKGDENEFDIRHDEKFALFDGVKGSGQVFALADILFDVTKEYANDKNEITVAFDTRFSEAFQKVQLIGKYNGKTEDKALEDFYKNGYDYFQTLLDNLGKTVVDLSLIDKSKRVAKLLMDDPFTEDVFRDSPDCELFTKYPVEWVYTSRDGDNNVCKSEIDIMKIDHKKKVIYLKDLKTNYDNENFEYSYLKYRYDLQNAFYYLAVNYWKNENDMKDYIVTPMEFIVGDTSSNNRRPIRYQMTERDLDAALNGCYISGTYYKGLHQIIDEISWAETNNTWNCSRLAYENKGILTLNLKYDK